MTVAANYRNDYVGNGTTADYDFGFEIAAKSELSVKKRDTSTGTETTLALTTDFTIPDAHVNRAAGGTITLTAGVLASGYALSLRRVKALTQTTDLRNQGEGFQETIENAIDKLTMISQQQQDEIDRSLKIPESEEPDGSLEIPAKEERASKLLGFDADGNPMASEGSGTPTSAWGATLVDDDDAAAGRRTLGIDADLDPVLTAVGLAAARTALGWQAQSVLNLAALKALSGANLTGYVWMAGYATAGDGGAGMFRWVASDSATANDGTIVQPTAGGGRFYRVVEGFYDVRWFGAFGDGTTTETTQIAAAISAAAAARRPLRIPATSSSYRVGTLTIPSNAHLVFDRGCTLSAISGFDSDDTLLDFDGASDVTIEAYGATFEMQKAEYVSGEHRHCFNLVDCARVVILGGTAKDSGGDGYYINGATDCRLVDVTSDNNRRNGMSIIKATRLRVVRPVLKNSTGTAPNAGLDIEPNSDADDLRDIVIDSPQAIDNDGSGFVIYLDDYKTGSPDDVEITINNPVSRSNGEHGLRVSNVFLSSGSYGGAIVVNNLLSVEDGKNGISIVDKGKDAPVLKINNPTIIDSCLANGAYPNHTAVLFSDSSACVSGEIHVDGLTVKTDHTGMDYGLYVESGGGFVGLRVSITDIKGHQIQPVRWGNLTSSIADASDALIDVSRLRGTTPRTSGINVDGDYAGTIFTNAGASGAVTFVLRHYLPPGNRYRFRVEAAQTITIDTSDATDVIVGTTGAGASVTCATIGEEAEVYYLGTFGSVRYWRLNILGKQANWTFN